MQRPDCVWFPFPGFQIRSSQDKVDGYLSYCLSRRVLSTPTKTTSFPRTLSVYSTERDILRSLGRSLYLAGQVCNNSLGYRTALKRFAADRPDVATLRGLLQAVKPPANEDRLKVTVTIYESDASRETSIGEKLLKAGAPRVDSSLVARVVLRHVVEADAAFLELAAREDD